MLKGKPSNSCIGGPGLRDWELVERSTRVGLPKCLRVWKAVNPDSGRQVGRKRTIDNRNGFVQSPTR